jgi:hypothetical protein
MNECKGGLRISSSSSVCSEAAWQKHWQLNCIVASLHFYHVYWCYLIFWCRRSEARKLICSIHEYLLLSMQMHFRKQFAFTGNQHCRKLNLALLFHAFYSFLPTFFACIQATVHVIVALFIWQLYQKHYSNYELCNRQLTFSFFGVYQTLRNIVRISPSVDVKT